MISKRILVALAAALVLASCSSSKKPQPATLKNLNPTLAASVAWQADVGKVAGVQVGVGQFTPAVAADDVVVASSSGVVTKLSLADGRVRWRTEVGARLVAGAALGSGVSSGVSAVVTDRGELVVLAADGKIQRTIALGGVALEVPLLLGNTAVVRLADNRVAGWDLATGNRRWVIQRTLPPLVLHAQSGLTGLAQAPEESRSAVLGPADVLVNMPGGRLLWLDASTGAIRWESQVATPRGSNEVERIVDLLGGPIAEGPDVCVAAYQTLVACFGAESGRRLWSRDLAAMSAVAADPRFVYVADDQSRLHALNRKDGSPAWTIDTFQLRNLMSPVSWGRAVWVADRFGVLHAVDRENGKELARITLGSAVSGAMRATQRGLLVQTQGGQLFLIRSEG
jgi:outer membrane protein assembly factor BamB